MQRAIYVRTFWGEALAKVVGAICEDGRQRTAYVTGEADTFFSIPARVSAGGTTVAGFLVRDSDGTWRFIAYKYRKNHALVGG